MRRKILVACLCAMFLFLVAGCSSTDSTPPADASKLYEQITAGMSYDEVIKIMDGHEPTMQSEGEIDASIGGVVVTTGTMTWQIGKSLIIVIFQDGKVQAKDLTKMP